MESGAPAAGARTRPPWDQLTAQRKNRVGCRDERDLPAARDKDLCQERLLLSCVTRRLIAHLANERRTPSIARRGSTNTLGRAKL